MKNIKLLVAIGFELTGIVVGTILIGQWADAYFGSKGIFTAGLLVVGFGAWVTHLVLAVKK